MLLQGTIAALPDFLEARVLLSPYQDTKVVPRASQCCRKAAESQVCRVFKMGRMSRGLGSLFKVTGNFGCQQVHASHLEQELVKEKLGGPLVCSGFRTQHHRGMQGFSGHLCGLTCGRSPLAQLCPEQRSNHIRLCVCN